MGIKRTPRSLKLAQEIDDQLSYWATKEGRSHSNLAEQLLKWSLAQLTIAKHVGVLMEWEARPASFDELDEESRKIAFHLEHQMNEEIARRRSLEQAKHIKTERKHKAS